MMFNAKSHWEDIYQKKKPNEVSWTQEIPQISIDFFKSFKLSKDSSIIDIGGGESKLVDYLLRQGYNNITVLDISKNAIEKAKKRIGENSDKVKWIVSDINEFMPENSFDFWHDRAVFHFMTSKKNISNYAKMVSDYATIFVVGTFSTDGPTKCSGLDICQYDEMSITKTFETSFFKKVESKRVDHETPFGTIQNFIFCSFAVTSP
ncbi:MAG TPA: class I SAM-dependent methyltransferase [Flavobacteriaceae bacterium]|nr:class I SAM-dependent methyltransferase [Flavobacteriaceae bacterium]